MKCRKCGAECKDTQTFCLKCGNALKREEFNSLETELANNVGAMLDGFDEDDDELEDYEVQLDDSFFEDKAKKVQKEMQIDNIYTKSSHQSKAVDEDEWEYDEDKYYEDMYMNEIEQNEEEQITEKRSHKKSRKSNKKKILLVSLVVCIVLGIAIVGGWYLLNNMRFNMTSFDDYYKFAQKEYAQKDYKLALSDAQSALKKAERTYNSESKENKKESAAKNMADARALICNVLESLNQIDDDYAENLSELVSIKEVEAEAVYYEKLAKYYSENKPPKELTDFLRSIDEERTDVVEALAEYIVPVPVVDKASGSYSEQFALTLTCEPNCSIWYTIDGSNPSTHGVSYTEPIKITEFRTPEDTDKTAGITVVKAIVINEKNVESKIAEFEYEIILEASEPIVTPDSGLYTEYTKIEISVPEGSRCYYTIAEGSQMPADPDENATKYITAADVEKMTEEEKKEFKELELLRGTYIMKFVFIDEYGIKSDVAVRSYNLDIPRNISLNDAEKLVLETFITDLETPDAENPTQETTVQPETKEGETIAPNERKAKWEETVVIDNQEYYIVYATEKTAAGVTLVHKVYAVNTYDKTVVKDVTVTDGKYEFPEPEEEETT